MEKSMTLDINRPDLTVGVVGTGGQARATPPTVSAELLCRDSWGARPPLPGGRPHTTTR